MDFDGTNYKKMMELSIEMSKCWHLIVRLGKNNREPRTEPKEPEPKPKEPEPKISVPDIEEPK